MSIEVSKKERVTSPLNFEWTENTFLDSKKMEVLDPDQFIDGNDVNFESDDNIEFMEEAGVGMVPPESGGIEDISVKLATTTTKPRKRRLSSAKQSESGSISRRKKKPKGMPKRPLSAYNLYFQSERAKILAAAEGDGAKIGFEGLGKIIGKNWREVDPVERRVYEKLAEKDSIRYKKEMEVYNELKAKKAEESEKASCVPLPIPPGLDHGSSSSQPPVTNAPSFHQGSQPKHISETYSTGQASVVPGSQHQNTFMRLDNVQSNPSLPPQHFGAGSYNGFSSTEASQQRYHPHFEMNRPLDQAQHGANQVAMLPPPSNGATNGEAMNQPNTFPMPHGMEIVLTDHSGKDKKYTVHYTCLSMTRDAAQSFLESIGANPDPRLGAPPPNSQGPHPGSWRGFH